MPKKQKTLSGWFDVKKPGRDDKAIETARNKALEVRRAAAAKKKPAPAAAVKAKKVAVATKKKVAPVKKKQPPVKKKAPVKRKAPVKKKKAPSSDDDEDMGSLDSFVVDDDEEEEDEASMEDSDESLKPTKKTKTATKTATKTTTRTRKAAPPPPKRKGTKKKQAYAESEDEDEDANSLDDFVVDEEEDEDELLADSEESESEDDELELVDPPKRKRMPVKTTVLELGSSEESSKGSSSDSSDDEGTSFLHSQKARPSKPSKALQRASVAAKTRHNPSLKAQSVTMMRASGGGGGGLVDLTKTAKTTKPKATKTANTKAKASRISKPKATAAHFLDDDSDDEVASPSPLKKTKTNKIHPPSKKTKEIEILSDSDSDIHVVEQSSKSKYFANAKSKKTNNTRMEVDSSDEEDLTPIKPRRTKPPTSSHTSLLDTPPASSSTKKKTTHNKPSKFQLSESDDYQELNEALRRSLEDTPSPTMKKKRLMDTNDTNTNTDDHVITNEEEEEDSNTTMDDDDDDNDGIPERKAAQPKKKKKQSPAPSQTNNNNDDDLLLEDSSDDEDERIALKRALKESKKDTKSAKKKKQTIHEDSSDDDDDDNDDKRLQLPDEDETSEEEGDVGEAYDEERNAADSVLHTAERLSAQVLRTMKEWMHDGTDDGNGTPQGMIVDGALSLGSLQQPKSEVEDASSSNANKHQWISHEVMKVACSGVTLSNYQLIGVNWLALLHGMKCNIEGNRETNVNGVLADEMGLGKTVQTIAFLAWLKQQRQSKVIDIDDNADGGAIQEPHRVHLIIVPVSVLPNWMREFETFCPEMNVVKYHGNLSEREAIQQELRQYLPSKNKMQQPPQSSLDVILAPVSYFQKEKSDDRRFLLKFKYDYLVVDEAHMLKNSQSTRYKMLDRVPTKHRLLLTGTPVQNSPQELLNMLCFLMPLFSRGGDSLDEGDSNKSVGDRMLQHFVDENMQQNGDEQIAYKKLKHLFAPFVLRRKKCDVIAQLLPSKERHVEFVDLDPAARTIYESIIEKHVIRNGKKIRAAIGDHLFTNLRKAAHHPLMLRTRHTEPQEVEHLVNHFHKYGAFKGEGSTKARVTDELTRFNDFHIHLTALDLIDENPHRRPDLERYILDEEALFCSAKFSRLRTLLPKLISEGHRILIFSVWTSCLDLLGCLMEMLGLEYLRMDGSCSSDVRQERIDRFNRDSSINVFLLSTKACGLGINLTAADTCIIHDLDFNPFNDLQAEDRCHRIGQKKKVTVYKLVTKGTVDADIYEMQERKSKMNAAIMESNADKKQRRDMLQTAVNRFLTTTTPTSPQAKKTKKKVPRSSSADANNKENEKKAICII